MGVHGLWRLIESSGKPVPLESLEQKVLAVDVSIWLHHFVKGFQDSKGAPLPNAHLLGIYHRLCKLLYFRIKPVFVFDGGVPVLKRQTIIKRQQKKTQTLSEADRIHKNLLSALIKHTALSKVLSEKTKAAITSSTPPTKKRNEEELYKLPNESLDSTISSDEAEEDSASSHSTRHYDLHSIDTQSREFKSLPVDVRHEILTDLKETRKQSSWGRLHELPAESDDFSVYQMNRLLKRQSVQSALEEAEQEMGGHSLSLGELEQILKDQGVISNIKGQRIASDENTRYLLIKDLKQAVEDAKTTDASVLPTINEEDLESPKPSTSKDEEFVKPPDKQMKTVADQEFEDDLQKAIALSMEEAPKTSEENVNEMDFSFLKDISDSEGSEAEDTVLVSLTPAQRYMMEYSGLTPTEIAKIIAKNNKTGNSKVSEIKQIQTDNNKREKQLLSKPTVTTDKMIDKSSGKEVIDTVEIMSDSDSSDFEDVESVQKNENSEVKSMEVVFNANENFEDDLFKDIFEEAKSENKTNLDVELKEKEAENYNDKIEEKEESPEKSEEIVEVFEQNITENTKTDQGIIPDSTEADKKEKTPEKTQPSVVEKLIEHYSNDKSKDKDSTQTSSLSVEQIQEMKENVEKERLELEEERSSKERMAGNITDQMYQEAQELLELFGVPYMTAPMEAEAQCAFLNLLDFTDGTITDDSDIWLFGGKTVYKNFFNQSKTVLEYKSENILHHFKLSREQMILLAMLVGSDYTVGLTGVGPVTALEILAAFPPKTQLISGLFEFKRWFAKGKGSGLNSLRSKLKNLTFAENFPNLQIAQAYLDPQVDKSNEKFTWAKPDVVGLTDFARRKFGWTQAKTEEILNPVLKRLEETKKQKSITDFYKTQFKRTNIESEKLMSKRVKTALERLEKGVVEEETVESKKTRRKKNENVTKTSQSKPKVSNKKKNIDIEHKRDKTTKHTTDPEIEILKNTETISKKRVKDIESEVRKDLDQSQSHKVNLGALHKREVIPQKQKDKTDMLRNKIKAIETYRKSKKGPGYVKPRTKNINQPKEDASYLSESGSD